MMVLAMIVSLLANAPAVPTDSVAKVSDSVPVYVPSASDDSAAAAKLHAAQEAWDGGSGHSGPGAPPARDAGLGSVVLQVFTSLALLVLLGAAATLAVRKSRLRTGARRKGSLIDVLETAPAGAGRTIGLVRIHDRVVAVAFAGNSVSAIAEFQGASAAEIIAETGTGKTQVGDFAATLDTLMDKFRHRPAAEAPE